MVGGSAAGDTQPGFVVPTIRDRSRVGGRLVPEAEATAFGPAAANAPDLAGFAWAAVTASTAKLPPTTWARPAADKHPGAPGTVRLLGADVPHRKRLQRVETTLKVGQRWREQSPFREPLFTPPDVRPPPRLSRSVKNFCSLMCAAARRASRRPGGGRYTRRRLRQCTAQCPLGPAPDSRRGRPALRHVDPCSTTRSRTSCGNTRKRGSQVSCAPCRASRWSALDGVRTDTGTDSHGEQVNRYLDVLEAEAVPRSALSLLRRQTGRTRKGQPGGPSTSSTRASVQHYPGPRPADPDSMHRRRSSAGGRRLPQR